MARRKITQKTLVRQSISAEIIMPNNADNLYYTTSASKKIAPYEKRVKDIEYNLVERWIIITLENDITESFSGFLFKITSVFK